MKSKRQLRRFFSEERLPQPGQSFRLSGTESRHLSQVIRLQAGDRCLVTDGKGFEAVAAVKTLRADGSAELTVEELSETGSSESEMRMRIFQAIPKQAKFDFLVQKAQELGAWELVPVITERTIVRIESGKKAEAKVERWNKIAVEAAKQSGSLQVLRLTQPETLEVNLSVIRAGEAMAVFHPDGPKITYAQWIHQLLEEPFNGILNLFIGPEGGFSENEIDFLLEYSQKKSCSFAKVGLGGTILKVDTAFIAALAGIRLLCNTKES